MSDQHPDPPSDDRAGGAGEYCREVEAYLCRKNDGHLIRIAGPSFSRVSGWAEQGIPLSVVYRGIDRYFERYYARGQRRRPVHVDFCEGDVLTVFDEWRRAVGFRGADGDCQVEQCAEGAPAKPADTGSPAQPNVRSGRQGRERRGTSDRVESRQAPPGGSALPLAAHVGRVIVRLTTLRAGGRLGAVADAAVDAAVRELDAARRDAAHLEGEARAAFVNRLRQIDTHLTTAVGDGLDERERRGIAREAEADLAPFRAGMPADRYEQARADTCTRLLRQRTGLPVIAYDDPP